MTAPEIHLDFNSRGGGWWRVNVIREGPKAVGDGEKDGEAPDGVMSSCISAAYLYVRFAGGYLCEYSTLSPLNLQVGLFRASVVARPPPCFDRAVVNARGRIPRVFATMMMASSSGGTGSSLARAAVIVAGVSSLVATLLSFVYGHSFFPLSKSYTNRASPY